MYKYLFIIILLVIFLFSSINSQEINITGTVKDTKGTAISSATVKLLIANKSATTNANGEYQITGTITESKFINNKNLIIIKPCILGSHFYFGLENNKLEKIQIFGINGKYYSSIFDGVLPRGNYKIECSLKKFASGPFIIKAILGNNVFVSKMLVSFNQSQNLSKPQKLSDIGTFIFLSKMLAVIDTLSASAPGYSEQKMGIESYTGKYDFVLTSSDFSLVSPQDKELITDTHKPVLKWNSKSGAVKYEVWMNISRTDYDWYDPTPLIDRYTKLADVTTTSYTCDSLMNRWTYKWYIIAVDGSGNRNKSEIRTFGKYIPILEQVNDSVPLLSYNGYQCRDLNKNGTIEPYEDWHNLPEVRVNDLMNRMTVMQKCQQLVYGDGANVGPGGGWFYFWPLDPQRAMNNQIVCAKAPWGIPFISAGDQINGYKVVFPNQAMLAASRNNDIVYKCCDLFRRCMLVNGAFGNLGPLAEINTSYGYWRVQEGCGEDADLAAAQCRAMIAGYHGAPELRPGSYLECLKHWPGQGAGGEGSVKYDWVTIKWHMKSWKAAMQAGLEHIMPGYATCALLQKEGRGAGDDPGIIGYLRDSLGFKGLITTDWLPSSAWVNAINAGSDVMGGAGFTEGTTTLYNAVTNNTVSLNRLNDACRKVLSVKFRLGIFENPYPLTPSQCDSAWSKLRAEGIHIQAAREGLTLLKNNGILPLSKLSSGDNILVGGPLANSQNCTYIWYSGWNEGTKTFQWWVTQRAQRNGINVVTSGNAKAAIAFVGETGYTHSGGSGSPPTSYDVSSAKAYKDAGLPVIIVYIMPRPALVPEVAWADAMVVAYRPGDGGPQAIAEFLFGDFKPKGKLPWQLPKTQDQINADDPSLPYDMGASTTQRNEIRALIDQNKPVPAIYGDPQFQWGFGLQDF